MDRENVPIIQRTGDVLDHSVIAFLQPASLSSPRYQFYPIWVHSHLVELYNQHMNEDHRYRPCSG